MFSDYPLFIDVNQRTKKYLFLFLYVSLKKIQMIQWLKVEIRRWEKKMIRLSPKIICH